MSDIQDKVMPVIMTVMLAISLMMCGYSVTDSAWRHWSIKVNAAHYDQQTGAWTAGPALTIGEGKP